MKKLIKKILKPFVPEFAINARNKFLRENLEKKRIDQELKDWYSNGCPPPSPHIIKQKTIIDYKKKYGYNILIETGTYLGTMVDAQKKRFKQIISIELGYDLYEKAKKRFEKDKNITICQGDSGKVLPNILKDINEPAIFWLDGHYSAGITALGDKECPIYEELDAIFNSKKLQHVLLIDDARCFTGHGDYPTIENLTKYITKRDNRYKVEVDNDIIRYTI